MFKIQENADGSTSVYHKKTGQHMCTIPVKPNSSSPLRINVVQPQPSCGNATVVVKDWRLSNFKTKVPDDSSTEESSDEDLKSSSSCRVSSPEPSDASEAPDDPKEAFLRALNLFPKGKKKMRGQWPLRRVSRVDPGWPRLITDLTPLSCRIGSQLLGEDPKLKETQLVAAVRKYEGLCVASGLVSVEPCHARLRCRRTAYPVCTSSKAALRGATESSHVYSYGRRQRRERLRVIETGLDRRSRQLLTQCRKCEVRLERVSKEEIKRWRRRPTPQQPRLHLNSGVRTDQPRRRRPPLRPARLRLVDVTRYIVHNPQDGHYYLGGTNIRVPHYAEFLAARRPSKPPQLLRPKNEPFIPVIDLTLDSPPKKSTVRALNGPNQPHVVSGQRPNQPHVVSNSVVSRQRTQPQSVLSRQTNQLHHGSYSLVSRQEAPQSVLLSRQTTRPPHRVGQSVPSRQATQLHHGGNTTASRQRQEATQPQQSVLSSRQRPPQLQVNHCVSRQRLSVANSVSLLRPPTHHQNSRQVVVGNAHGPVLRAMLRDELRLPTHFRCFACGCNRFITSSDAELEVLEHMRRFHSVSDPDRFLTVYRDQVKRCTIVEAFPGYKSSND